MSQKPFAKQKLVESLLRPATKSERRQQLQKQVVSAPSIDHALVNTAGKKKNNAVIRTQHHDNYEILSIIGEDDLSVTHEAFDPSLRRNVAIRMLAPRHAHDERKRAQFWCAAEFEASIRHEHILTIHATDRNRDWVITEAFDHSLLQRMKAGAVSASNVLKIVSEVLSALAYLHERGNIHGDICPSTILFNKEGRVKLSRTPGLISEIPLTPGRAKYRAPELLAPQLFGEVGPQVDLYSLGMTIIELLAGPRFGKLFRGLPTQDPSDDDWARWHCSPTERLPGIANQLSRVPAELARVIDGMIEKRVADRYAMASEAYADLHATASNSVPASPANAMTVAQSPDMSRGRALQQTEVRDVAQQPSSIAIPASLLPDRSTRVTSSSVVAAEHRTGNVLLQRVNSLKPVHWISITASLVALTMFVATRRGELSTSERPVDQVARVAASTESVTELPHFNNEPPGTKIEPVVPPPVLDIPDLPEEIEDSSVPDDVPLPPVPPVEKRAVTIHSTPAADASVSIDGDVEVTAPATVWLADGVHRIDVKRIGFQPTSLIVQVGPESTEKVHVLLTTQPPLPRFQPKIIGIGNEQAKEVIEVLTEIDEYRNRPSRLVALPNGWYEQADRLRDPRIHHMIALYLVGKNRLAEAILFLANANRTAPDNYLLPLRRLIWCYGAQQNDEKALAACLDLIRKAAHAEQPELLQESAHFAGQVIVALGLESQHTRKHVQWESQFRSLLPSESDWRQYQCGKANIEFIDQTAGNARFVDVVNEPLELELRLVWSSF